MFKGVYWLSAIVSLRFFGLFVVLPMLSLYALQKEGANALYVGLIMGGYAFTQMLFMYPFGALSDKISRKKVIIAGLVIFIIGSILCAIAQDAATLLAGRLLQGAGSIGSVVTAMISDFTTEEKRGHAMAIMGGSIALSFMGSMLLGPVLGAAYGVDKLFWLTALLALGAILILLFAIPEPPKIHHVFEEETGGLGSVLKDKNLLNMDLMIFLHAALMTIIFLIIPITLTSDFGWQKSELWKVYVPAVVLGIAAMGPAAILGEKYDKIKHIFLLSIFLFALAFMLMALVHSELFFIAAILLFFVGFNMQEPLLQSSASKFAKVGQKGTALGVFNTFQSLGAFLGGVTGGALLHYFDLRTMAGLLFVIIVMWLLWTLRMENPTKKAFLYLPLSDKLDKERIKAIGAIKGVLEYYINATEKILVIKYDDRIVTEEKIRLTAGL